MSTPCGPNIAEKGDISERKADQLAERMLRIAEARARRDGTPLSKSLQDIAGEITKQEDTMSKILYRNNLLTIQAKRQIKDFARRFNTIGEGILALLEGSNKRIPGARNSIDYNIKSINGKYFGRLVNELDQAGVLHDFRTGKNKQNIYREMGNLGKGRPDVSVTGDQSAYKIAKIVDSIYEEMVARQNRAGAYIFRMAGYIGRQTHDQGSIRALGSLGNSVASRAESFRRWDEFTRPLLDPIKTFQGADPDLFMRNIHEALYSGIHGAERDEANIMLPMVMDNLGKKVSESRVLHFRDADSAFKYNEAFGTRDFKESILQDIHQRARSIGLMEGLGPYPQRTIDQVKRELAEEARTRDDSAKQVDSLKKWGIDASMNELTGKNEIPANFSLNRHVGTAKVLLQLAKMGGVTLSSFADKAFMQSEAAFQGMNQLTVLGKQISGMFPRGPEQKSFLRMMGVAMDGLMGNALSRYSNHSTMSGWAHEAQRRFFDLNLLNSWTDANKGSMAELMSSHLGENSHLSFTELPDDLRNVLSLYDITSSRWDALRNTAWTQGDSLGKFISPDKVAEIPDSTIKGIVEENGLTASPTNLQRERDKLETSLRTYFQDRVDIAIPTPGVATRRWATMNTQAGTPLGEAVRLLMLFKSFPITILDKVVGRNIYGRGADSLKEFITSDHRGKFDLAMLVAMGTAAGYLSGMAHDALAGKEPKPLVTDEGLNWGAINDAAIRGGALGILGDVTLTSFNHDYRSFLQYAAGPIAGQLDSVAALKTSGLEGKNIGPPLAKMMLDNAPFINLFYIRPILNYFVLWNLEEMLSPGTLRRRESAVEQKGHQEYFIRPSDVVNR